MFVADGLLFDSGVHMFDGGGWWMMIFPVIFAVLVILMMFGFWRRGPGMGTGPPMSTGSHSEARSEYAGSTVEVLRRRYAAGELTDEQFDVMRRKLEDQT